MEKDLTIGDPFKVIVLFSLPIIGGNLFQLLYTLADTVIVGQVLGSDALAAVGSTGIIIYLVLCFVQGITGGFGICLGHQFGRRDEIGMRQSATASFLLSAAAGILITLLSCGLAHPILKWMNTPQAIYDMAYDYMFVVLLGTGATVFYNLISNLLRALGDSRTPLIFLIVSSVLNIVLDYLFMAPFRMGVTGAALATVLSQLISAGLCIRRGYRQFAVLRLGRKDFSLPGKVLKTHLRIGFPMGFQMSVMCIGQIAMQGAVNALGAAAIAGYTAATKVDQVSVLVNTALGVAVSGFVAQNYGAHKPERIRAGVRSCLLLAAAGNLAMCAAILLCRNLVIPLFVSDPAKELYPYANLYFFSVAPFYVLLGVLIIIRSSVQSMGNSKAPFCACMAELVIRICATTLLAGKIGYVGICLATPLAWMGAIAVLAPQYHKCYTGSR